MAINYYNHNISTSGSIAAVSGNFSQNLIIIIDIATQRGLFKASDLMTIGGIYEKLRSIDKILTENKKTE